MIRQPFLYLALGIIILLASSYGVSRNDPITMLVYGLPAAPIGIASGIFHSSLVQRQVEKTGVWIPSKKTFLIGPATILMSMLILLTIGFQFFFVFNWILLPIVFLWVGVAILTEAILCWNWENRSRAKMFLGMHSFWRSMIIAVPKTTFDTAETGKEA
jgi:Zn-dependent protease with chaperone function